jgi:hypothetical protein
MLLVLLALLYMLALTFLYGSAATILLERYLPSPTEQRLPFSVVGLTGMLVLALITGYLSLFMKIGALANLIVLLGAIVLYLLHRRQVNDLARNHITALKTAPLLIAVLVVFLCALALIEATEQPKDGDTGLYHLQTIKWIETYHVVPGLGNLDARYAWNSMWYPLSALFGFSFLGIPTLHVVNGALFLLVLGFFFGGVRDVITGSISFTSLVKTAAIPFSLFVYNVQIGSASTDMPAALLLWVACILCIENNQGARSGRSRATNVIAGSLLVYAVTVKLGIVPILVLVLYLLYLQYRMTNSRDIWVQIGLGVVIMVPWVTRNIILSGYLIFPFQYIDILDVDWKVPYRDVVFAVSLVRGWARLPGPNWRESLDIPVWEWVPKWLGSMSDVYAIAIVMTFLIILVAVQKTAVRVLRSRCESASRDIVYLTACMGGIFWFWTAPDPRFGWGFIFVALVIPLVPAAERVVGRFGSASRLILLATVAFFIVHYTYASIRSLPRRIDVLASPLAYPRDRLVSERVGRVVVYGPKTSFCWDAPLPCTDVLNDRLRPRGGDLQSGFRIAETPARR